METTIDSTVQIQLHSARHDGLVALVSVGDEHLLVPYRWRVLQAPQALYAVATDPYGPSGSTVYMHRVIVGASRPNDQVDHINHNGLDNRRDNLRLVTVQQNAMNRVSRKGSSSQFKGVSWDSRERKWKAATNYQRRTRSLGYFTSEVEAANAYDAAARELYGEYAYLNFPEVQR